MAIKNKIAFTTLSVCLSTAAWAQQLKLSHNVTIRGENVTEEKIENNRASTLLEVYDTALEKNIPYLLNDRNYRAVFTRIEQAKSKYRPQVELNARAGYTSMGQTARNYLSSSAGINASLILYSKGLKLGVSQAEIESQVAEKQLMQARQELMGLVAHHYLDLILKEDQVRLANEKNSNLRKVFNSTQTSVNVGVQSKDALAPIEADLQRSQIKVLEATQLRNAAQNKFETDFEISFKTYLSASNANIPKIGEKTDSQWLDEAEQNSLKIHVQRLTADAARMGYQKEKASNGGVWKLEGRVGVDRNPIIGESNIYQNRLESGRSIFITWTKPLFDGGYRSAVKDELAYRQESAELQTTQATNQAREDVRLALDNYRLAMNTIRVQRNIIHTSQQIIDSIKLGSTAGNSNYDRLLQETSKLYENKYELSQANV
ncbi:MAG: TolC family protein, partial [Bdellovibrio sp.]|nr:TolC family protein [Bdellovibrio sp.]